jgi:hypothetical protein
VTDELFVTSQRRTLFRGYVRWIRARARQHQVAGHGHSWAKTLALREARIRAWIGRAFGRPLFGKAIALTPADPAFEKMVLGESLAATPSEMERLRAIPGLIIPDQ